MGAFMCRVCAGSLLFDKLTSGISAEAPNRRQFMAYAAGVTATGATGVARAASTADTIFHNGVIFPMTGKERTAEALAIGGGKILAVGANRDVLTLSNAQTQIVDLRGRALFPGFIDPHHHTVLSATFTELLTDLGYVKYPKRADAMAALKAVAEKTPQGQWILAGFFDNLLQGGDLSMAELDAISTEHPIFVLYVSAHTAAVNTKAIEDANLQQNISDIPGGGHFGRDAHGRLNGLVYEMPAMRRFLDHALPPLTPEFMAKAVVAYAKRAAAVGNTTLHEPGTIKPGWVLPIAKLSNQLDVRLSASLSVDEIEASKTFAALGVGSKARHIPGSRFSLYGVKLWADGANQSETAAQTKPYLHSANKGKTNYSKPQIVKLCQAAKNAGWPVMIHCHGDAAIDEVLDALETAYGANPDTGINRLEHATMARQDQIARTKRLGAEISFHPNLLFFYGAAYRDDIFGHERARDMVPAGAAYRAGIPFSLHTDAAAAPMGPLRLVQTAVTRRCAIDHSIIGPEQAVTLEQALKAITINAARHIGLGDTIGSLEPGKEADLTILESNPFRTDPEKIMSIKISETWVAGEKKFG